jgi:DNA-directed RNA polymerase subunit M/transcription elongation factor TFIIS
MKQVRIIKKAKVEPTSETHKRHIQKMTSVKTPQDHTTKKTRKPQQRKKVSKFDIVANGNCPHCFNDVDIARTLDVEVANKGDGVTRTCKNCGHKWYLNRTIHTCKCLTCSSRLFLKHILSSLEIQ